VKILTVCAWLLLACGSGFSMEGQPETAVEAAARSLAAEISDGARNPAPLFDRSLFRAVSLENLKRELSPITEKYGPVTKVLLERAESDLSAHFIFETGKGFELPISIYLNAESKKISGFFQGKPSIKLPWLDGLKGRFAGLPGKAGFILRRIGGSSGPAQGYNHNERFAVAGAFRLYVLGALQEAGVGWEKTLRPGRARARAGARPASVAVLAAGMMAAADPHAADRLIEALGRDKLEKSLVAQGYSSPDLMRPFLKPSESEALRNNTPAWLEYLNTPLNEKYAFLSGLKGAPAASGAPGAGPFPRETIDWPSTPADLCRAMEYIQMSGSAPALYALAAHKGPGGDTQWFSRAGYAGGSAAGVLSAVWLLRGADDSPYCLAAVWNGGEVDLNEKEFFGLTDAVMGAGAVRAPERER
jgi:hypothetical protein